MELPTLIPVTTYEPGSRSFSAAMTSSVWVRVEPVEPAIATRTGRAIEDVRKASVATIPFGRLGDPEEFANLVVFLASAKASYISGQGIFVDGAAGTSL